MSDKRRRDLTAPEQSVLGDAVQHGVVKVGQWKLAKKREVGSERIDAADRLGREGLLYQTGESPPAGAQRRSEEYIPTPRGRRRNTINDPS